MTTRQAILFILLIVALAAVIRLEIEYLMLEYV